MEGFDFGELNYEQMFRYILRRLDKNDEKMDAFSATILDSFQALVMQFNLVISNMVGDLLSQFVEGIPFIGPILGALMKAGSRVFIRINIKPYGGYNY